MSTLSSLLLAKQPLFDLTLVELEKRSGKQGVDARLTAQLATKSAHAIQELGLAPDCTAEELYAALRVQVRAHDAHLARTLGGSDPTDVDRMIPLVLKRIAEIDMPRQCYALKDEVAAAMLAKQPPVKMLERLGYKDVAQMVAKEDLSELFIALRFTEGEDWLNQFNTVYMSLTAKDFENRPIRLVRLQAAKWGDVAAHFIEKKKHINTHSKEMGVVAILPPPTPHMAAITLKVLTLTLHYYNEVRLYSAYFKLMSQHKDFGKIIVDTLTADPAHVEIVQGTHIHFRVIQRYFGKLGDAHDHPEIFEPHLQPEDLHWRAAESIVYKIDPEMAFWKDMDYVAVIKNKQIVTFNLMDVTLSYANGITFKDRYLYHFRESLWNQLFASYFGQPVLHELLLKKLDNAIVKPELLRHG